MYRYAEKGNSMGTTEKMLDQATIDNMVSELHEWPNSGSGDDEQELTVGPFVSFIFYSTPKNLPKYF